MTQARREVIARNTAAHAAEEAQKAEAKSVLGLARKQSESEEETEEILDAEFVCKNGGTPLRRGFRLCLPRSGRKCTPESSRKLSSVNLHTAAQFLCQEPFLHPPPRAISVSARPAG